MKVQRGKLLNFHALLQNKDLIPHIPKTQKLDKETFFNMLQKHTTLYIKPDVSSQGIGIICVQIVNNMYEVEAIDTGHISIHNKKRSLWDSLLQLKRKQPYIIQQGIVSETQLQHPFDIRVHVVKVNGIWTFGGMIGKVAKKQSIVTNACKGATPTPINTLLQDYRNLSEEEATDVKEKIKKISLIVSRTMGKKYTNWNEFGLDVGLDENNHPWLYEVNFRPGFILFRHIDQPAYLLIKSLRKKAS